MNSSLKITAFLLGLVALALGMAGCIPGLLPGPPPLDLTGTWEGTVEKDIVSTESALDHLSVGPDEVGGPFTLELAQDGVSLSGTFTDEEDNVAGTLTGEVDRQTRTIWFEFTIDTSGVTVTFSMEAQVSPDGETMTGTAEISITNKKSPVPVTVKVERAWSASRVNEL
jgi:hypothetical protein